MRRWSSESQDGLLTEAIYQEYADLGLTHAPTVTRVSTGEEALAALDRARFDLVISMLRLGDMDVRAFADAVRSREHSPPIVLLTTSDWELGRLDQSSSELHVDGTYVWQGDTKLFLAIIKVLEDRWNAPHDTQVGDVGVIILVEDSLRFRSSLIPLMYAELVKQTRSVLAEGLNRQHRLARLRARPKILVAEDYTAAVDLYDTYKDSLFGVIADVSFPRDGAVQPRAGVDLIAHVKADRPDTPTLLQSSDPANRAWAQQYGADFLHKHSTTLLEDLRRFMVENFGFGDFVFRLPDGREVGRAADLRAMARVLSEVPAAALEYHATRNHFSNWLRARTEFALARRLRPRRISDFGDVEGLRAGLRDAVQETLRVSRRGVVEEFNPARFDPDWHFARIGGGSLGGKARGLAFVDVLLAGAELDQVEDVRLAVPRSVAIATEVFDRFLEDNHLRLGALRADSADWLRWAFLSAQLPDYVVRALRLFLEQVRTPIAVRSSSLLEDSHYHAFAGVYATYMLPNNEPDDVRLLRLCDAIKLVYASTFSRSARDYLAATPYRVEEEKMAVLLQPIVGTQHGEVFYPSFAGVARSYNYYPFEPMRAEDGVASVVLGLGRTVVDGGSALRFCPAHPHVIPELGLGEAFINQSQREFLAIDLRPRPLSSRPDPGDDYISLDLDEAERHGTLDALGSSWDEAEQRFRDGVQRPGPRAITFAHILKNDLFPLAHILRRLLALGREGMNRPVEIEFAADLRATPRRFYVLQIRPSQGLLAGVDTDLAAAPRERVLVDSPRAMGNGVITGVRDIVYVPPQCFDAQATRRIAAEVAGQNALLLAAGRPYILIGPGRWGSSDPALGIPVQWPQIHAARVIVETTLANFVVDPSQGSHFFQNLTSFGIAYLTVRPEAGAGFVDWDWLAAQPDAGCGAYTRHVRLAEPLEVRVAGHLSRAVICKP